MMKDSLPWQLDLVRTYLPMFRLDALVLLIRPWRWLEHLVEMLEVTFIPIQVVKKRTFHHFIMYRSNWEISTITFTWYYQSFIPTHLNVLSHHVNCRLTGEDTHVSPQGHTWVLLASRCKHCASYHHIKQLLSVSTVETTKVHNSYSFVV